MAAFSPHVHQHTMLVVQDQSPLVGVKASYSPGLDQKSDRWIVTAVCANNRTIDDATSVEIVVIPREKVTPAVKEKMRAGKFGKLSCEDVWSTP